MNNLTNLIDSTIFKYCIIFLLPSLARNFIIGSSKMSKSSKFGLPLNNAVLQILNKIYKPIIGISAILFLTYLVINNYYILNLDDYKREVNLYEYRMINLLTFDKKLFISANDFLIILCTISIYSIISNMIIWIGRERIVGYNNKFIVLFFHFLNTTLIVFFCYLLIEFTQLIIREFDSFFLYKNLFLFDFFLPNYKNEEYLNHGIYIGTFSSLIICIILSLRNFPNLKSKLSIDFLVIIIVLLFGFYISIFSITNIYCHFINSITFKSFILNEINYKLFPLRLTSLILFWELVTFTLKHLDKIKVMTRGYWDWVYGKVSPLYISQIGYYILLILILYYTHQQHSDSLSAQLLNWSLFFIVDDWSIIYAYYMKFNKMLKWHFYRIFAFNILTYFFGMYFFYQTQTIELCIFFSILCILLILFRYFGFSSTKTELTILKS